MFKLPPDIDDTKIIEHHSASLRTNDSRDIIDSVEFPKLPAASSFTPTDEIVGRKHRSGKEFTPADQGSETKLIASTQTTTMPTDLKLDVFHNTNNDIKFSGNKTDMIDIHTLLDDCESIFTRRNISQDSEKIAILSSRIEKVRCPAANLLKSDKLLRTDKYEEYKKVFLKKFSGKTSLEGISPELHKLVDYVKNTEANNSLGLDDITADVSIIKKTLLSSINMSKWVNDQNMMNPTDVVDLIGYIAALSKLSSPVLKIAKTIPYEKGVNLLDYLDEVELQCSKAGITSSQTTTKAPAKSPETVAAVTQAPVPSKPVDQRQSRPKHRQPYTQKLDSRGNTPYGRSRSHSRRNTHRNRQSTSPAEMCYYCAHKGHRITQCYIKAKEETDKSKGYSPYCRFHKCVGHWTADCKNVKQIIYDYKSGEDKGRMKRHNT